MEWATHLRLDVFHIGGNTTNRTEAINSAIKRLVNRCTTMDMLVDKLLKFVANKIREITRREFRERTRPQRYGSQLLERRWLLRQLPKVTANWLILL